MSFKATFSALFFCLLSLSHRDALCKDDSTIYRGTVGKSQIVIDLWAYQADKWDKDNYGFDTLCYGQYFYLSSLQDIKLRGHVKNGEYILERTEWTRSSEDSVVERFSLHRRDAGYEGVWSGKGKSLPVKLEPLPVTSIHNSYDGLSSVDTMRNHRELDYVRASLFEVKRDSIRTYQSHRVEWLSIKHSTVSLFEIIDGYDSAALSRINRRLLDIMIEQASNELSCCGPGGGEGEYLVSVPSYYFGKNVLSIDVFVNFTCDGPHPDFGTDSYNFNAHTGDELELTDITTFGFSAPPPRSDEYNWFKYHDTLADYIVEVLEELYPKEMQPPDSDDCDYSTPDKWKYAGWSFTDKGIMLSPSIAHVGAPCRDPDWLMLPYAYLNKHRNKKLKIKIP